jgi:hypothetical protein
VDAAADEFVRVNTGHAAVRVGSGGSVEGFPDQGVVEAAGEFDDDGGTCGGLDARPGTGPSRQVVSIIGGMYSGEMAITK